MERLGRVDPRIKCRVICEISRLGAKRTWMPMCWHARGTEPQLSGRSPTSATMEWLGWGHNDEHATGGGLRKRRGQESATQDKAKHALTDTPLKGAGDIALQAVVEGLASVSSSVERSTTVRKSIIQSVDASVRFRVVEKMSRGGPGQQLGLVDDGPETCSTAAEIW